MRLNSFLLLTAVLPYAAAQSSLTPPALGYAYDSGARAIRPVYGTPGAAILGSLLRMSVALKNAVIAPLQDYALVVTDEGTIRLVRFTAGRPPIVPIPGALSEPDRIIFSPSGTAAVLVDTRSERIQSLTGLPESPAVQEVQTPAASETTVVAVADDGILAIADGNQVRIIAPGLNTILGFPAATAAMAFRPANHDLAGVASSGEVYLATNVDGNTDIRQIHAQDLESSDPLSVQFSPNLSSIFVINRGGIVANINLITGSASTLLCECLPTGLQPFGHAGLFRITDISNKPVLLFDGTAAKNRFWFIPVDAQRIMQ